MIYKYFKIQQTTTFDQVRIQYLDLVKLHHPDKGGKAIDFNAMMEEYTYLLARNKQCLNLYEVTKTAESEFSEYINFETFIGSFANKLIEKAVPKPYREKANDLAGDIIKDFLIKYK